MPRDFNIYGECLVLVRGGAQFASGEPLGTLSELGLADSPIVITPTYYHKDIYVDDFGPNVPAEVMWNIAEINIRMSLIHYDHIVLDACMAESQGGAPDAGVLMGAGSMMGNGIPLFSSGCHYMSLNLTSPVLNFPYRFPTSYMTTPPLTIPLSTTASVVICNWRAIPYISPLGTRSIGVSGGSTPVFEILSSGLTLYDHILDSEGE